MGQLTLKDLDRRLDDYAAFTNERLDDLEGRISTLGETMSADSRTIGEGFVEVDRLIDELSTNLSSAFDQVVDASVPGDIIRAIIEALHGVRLQRAGEMAAELEAKYFPQEDVEEEEGD